MTHYFLKEYQSEKSLRQCKISDSYAELLREGRGARSGGAVRPSDLKNNLSRVSRQFSGYGQQDAQELLRCLLDGIHNELNRVPT